MKMTWKKHSLLIIFLVLFCAVIFIFISLFQSENHKYLTFATLDIGQGDGLFIESPSGAQVLFDAGPVHKILSPLSRVMPFYDKKINAIVITNPDADHIGGFVDVLKNYEVEYAIEPGTFNPSKTYVEVERLIAEHHVKRIIARRGMRLDLGKGANIDILFPDRDVSTWETNDGSIVGRLFYGKNSVMLTGDATQKTERIILSENSPAQLKSDILKVGHHGSHTSSSREFVQAVSPSYAVISDGKGNKYGHPHKETLDTLNSFNIKILRTDLLGTIIFKSNGLDFILR